MVIDTKHTWMQQQELKTKKILSLGRVFIDRLINGQGVIYCIKQTNKYILHSSQMTHWVAPQSIYVAH